MTANESRSGCSMRQGPISGDDAGAEMNRKESNGSARLINASRNQIDYKELKAGDMLVYDFREEEVIELNHSSPLTTIKCIQWNIERGYKLDKVIRLLENHHADVICLQELDIGCERTEGRDCAWEIARALRMKCAFFVEFEEIWSPARKPHLQGGGLHGNAILSRFDFDPHIIRHAHHPFLWEQDGARLGEPRRGERAVLKAHIRVPGIHSPVICYNLHLELFCGIFGRLRQFADALADARLHAQSNPYQVLFGDLNTMAHGIARFSPHYCRDTLRFTSIGYSEACWWQRYVLDVLDNGSKTMENHWLLGYAPNSLECSETRRLINPHFYDPFSIIKDTTLQGYGGVFRGKLDWTLLRGWHVLGKGMDNHDFSSSDHKLLHVILRPAPSSEAEPDPGVTAYKEQYVPINHQRVYLSSIFWTATATSLAILGTSWLINRWLD